MTLMLRDLPLSPALRKPKGHHWMAAVAAMATVTAVAVIAFTALLAAFMPAPSGPVPVLSALERCRAVFAAGQAPVRQRQGERPAKLLCKEGGREPFFAVAFDVQRGIPRYVAHTMSARNLETATNEKRRSSWFVPDPEIATLSDAHQASTDAYKGSGFDRGHLVAARDMKWSANAWRQTFLYSAIVPQAPAFNRGRWRKAEGFAHTLIQKNVFSRLWIITGVYGMRSPLYLSTAPALPSIPACFYKVWVVHLEDGTFAALAVLMANTDTQTSPRLEDHVLALDALEAQAGVDFLPGLEVAGRERVDSALWRIGRAAPTVACT